MKKVTLQNVDVTNGAVLVGKFDSVEKIMNDLETELKSIVSENYNRVESAEEYLDLFSTRKASANETYTLIHITQELLTKHTETIINLINEKRPLKLVPVLSLQNIYSLSEELLDAIFGNFGYFIIGELTEHDEQTLKTRLPESTQ